MAHMVVTLDTSHLEISPVNSLDLGTISSLNNWLISITAEISQDPTGPCGLLEQSKDNFLRHSPMAACSSALDFGVQPGVRYSGSHTVGVRMRVRIKIGFRVRVRVRFMVG